MQIQFSKDAWSEYLYWQAQDKRTLRRINDLLQDIGRGGYQGIGKPEPLRSDLSGYWSRRIDEGCSSGGTSKKWGYLKL